MQNADLSEVLAASRAKQLIEQACTMEKILRGDYLGHLAKLTDQLGSVVDETHEVLPARDPVELARKKMHGE